MYTRCEERRWKLLMRILDEKDLIKIWIEREEEEKKKEKERETAKIVILYAVNIIEPIWIWIKERENQEGVNISNGGFVTPLLIIMSWIFRLNSFNYIYLIRTPLDVAVLAFFLHVTRFERISRAFTQFDSILSLLFLFLFLFCEPKCWAEGWCFLYAECIKWK